jgi:hypothetical protein
MDFFPSISIAIVLSAASLDASWALPLSLWARTSSILFFHAS